MPTLSVIVPVYNAGDFLPTCLELMRANSDENIQFVVIDDHSTDETPYLLDAAQKDLRQLTVLRNDTNKGVAHSRNRALGHVEGRYLTYVDADDWYAPGHLQALLNAIQELGVAFVRTDHVRVDGLHRTVERAPEKHRSIAMDAVDGIGVAGTPSPVDYPFLWAGIYDTRQIARDLLLFDESLRTAADRPWFWRLHLEAPSTAVVDHHGYFYRKDHNPRALTQAGNPYTLHFLDASKGIREAVLPTENIQWITKAAWAAARICGFHVSRRQRLSPELQAELFDRAGELLASYPPEPMDHAIRTLSLPQRTIARALVKKGRRQ